jgi:hypothetical protein
MNFENELRADLGLTFYGFGRGVWHNFAKGLHCLERVADLRGLTGGNVNFETALPIFLHYYDMALHVVGSYIYGGAVNGLLPKALSGNPVKPLLKFCVSVFHIGE